MTFIWILGGAPLTDMVCWILGGAPLTDMVCWILGGAPLKRRQICFLFPGFCLSVGVQVHFLMSLVHVNSHDDG